MRRMYLFTILMIAATVISACGGPSSASGPVATPQAGQPAAPAGASQNAQQPAVAPGTTPAPQALPGAITMNGAGATFPYPLYSRWFYEYASVDPSVKFNYQSIGSGGGIQQITAKTVDFGASDAILTADQLKAAPGLQMLPSVAGAVVPAYNLSDIKDAKQPLVLDGPTLVAIFQGKINKWNDPAIVKLNPDLKLPAKDIVVVHRSDGSGTTFIFTDYLSTISADWKSSVGNSTSVNWPTGLGGKGNEGVAGTIAQNDGSIGYVELAYALQTKMPIASMVNAAGATVQASIPSTQNAMADYGGQMPDTLARSIVNAPGKDSWPIAGYTYLLVYMDQQDCAKAQKLVGFINWAQKNGPKFATDLSYAPLPDGVRTQVLNKVNTITCQGKPVGQ